MTPLASQDMDSALGYIAENLCNEKAARELYFGIERGIETICEFPYSSPDCKLFLITDEKIRHILIDNYALIYEIKEEEKEIVILRFRFSKMNLKKVKLTEE